jgi:hypothetical protein
MTNKKHDASDTQKYPKAPFIKNQPSLSRFSFGGIQLLRFSMIVFGIGLCFGILIYAIITHR